MSAAALKLKTNLLPTGMTYQLNNKTKIDLDSSDRLDLQRYILEGMTLPTTDSALKSAFFLTDEMLPNFKDLLNAFKKIQTHCDYFYNNAFTLSVSLASSIVEFSFSAKYYLTGIAKIADDYNHGRITIEYAESSVKSLIDLLLGTFNGYIEKCNKVCEGVNKFLKETYDDNVTMNGQDGKTGLNKAYKDKYSLNTSDITQLTEDISNAMRELDQATSDYNYYVTVAATTPTYAWIFPFGTIPAVVVAGVYGDRATKAYKKMGELREKIKTSTQQKDQKIAMSSCLLISSTQVSKLAELMKNAIQPIEKMKGTWMAISDDLAAVRKTVSEDITQLPMVVKSLGVDKALEQWELVAKEADEYRKHAFISSTSKNMAEANILQFPEIKRA